MKQQNEVIEDIIEGKQARIGPEHVVIDVTNRCNNNCIGCWTRSPLLRDKIPGRDWAEQELPFDAVITLIDDLKDLGTERIRFTGGGEPCMHPQFLDVLRYTKSKDLICAVTTNFTLVDDEFIEEIIRIGLDELAVSLWSGDPVTYSRIHLNKSEKTFKRIKANLSKLAQKKKKKPFVTLCNVLFNMNYMNVEDMYGFALDVKADGIYFTVLDPVPRRTDCLLLKADERTRLLHSLESIKNKEILRPEVERLYLDNFDNLIRRLSDNAADTGDYDKPAIDSIPCYVGWYFCRIMADGGVSPCCRGVHKVLGNINHTPFRDIWHSPAYNEFRYNARHLKKSHEYFHPIGCYRTCDNFFHNQVIHKQVLDRHPEMENILTDLK